MIHAIAALALIVTAVCCGLIAFTNVLCALEDWGKRRYGGAVVWVLAAAVAVLGGACGGILITLGAGWWSL